MVFKLVGLIWLRAILMLLLHVELPIFTQRIRLRILRATLTLLLHVELPNLTQRIPLRVLPATQRCCSMLSCHTPKMGT